jgi:hypothetical protein
LKSPKIIVAIGTIFLVLIAIYLKITDSSVSGSYVGKYGGWQNSTVSANAVFFFAAVMAGIWWAIVWSEKKDK